MRLLKRTKNGGFELTRNLAENKLPRYAILSHTWLADDEEEVNFKDIMENPENKPAGFAKIRFCGEQAAKHGLDYFWVDTCCINKESSEELREAITSMFSWYQNAVRCYAYLADVSAAQAPVIAVSNPLPSSSWELDFRCSKWFTRGWTLQELLAPASVEFFSLEGTRLGDKKSLEHYIHEITEIPLQALRGEPLTNFTVAERFSWAKNRQTKRKEDGAYCLLGIFNIFMGHNYGEGDHAFTRLKEEIDKKQVEKPGLDQFLSTLPIATEAAFNSRNNQHEPMCLPNTRTELLQDIVKWADGLDDRCIFWLRGIAGTGKSTVARTIARTYDDRGNLGASFFFSRGSGDLRNANRLITTLAWQLAIRVPSARRCICEAIMEQKDIVDKGLQYQWDQLILKPLSKLNSNSPSPTVLLVVDALDECDDEKDIRVILRILSTARLLSNIRLRIFITSRPDISIRHSFGKIPEEGRQVFVLDEISQTLVDRDLGLFFENHFLTIREERGFGDDWPGVRIMKRLVEISCGLFIWASTACRWIRAGKQLARTRINILINGHRSGEGPEKQLDQIYISVLKDSIPQDYSEKEKAKLYDILREVLGNIVILFSPLSVDSLANLLDKPMSHIKETLADWHTIFHIPNQTCCPIRLHHPTFRDFLLDKKRCSDLDFWVDEKQAHRALADNCIMLMSKMLKRDICGLKSPGTFVKDVDPDQIEQCIPLELQYACLYWVQHYRQSETRLSDGDRVHLFFRKYFLYWLEAINLLGKSSEMGAIIRLYHSLLAVMFQPADNLRQLPFVKDARRFIFAFQNTIKQAPLQTYCAALACIPLTNELKFHFWDQMHPWIKDIRIAEAIGPQAKDEFNYVSDLAFTPDSKQIASGSNFEAVRLWDVTTKATLCKYEGSTDKMSSVAISPDGMTLAAGSDDFTVMVWDIRTRELRYALKEAHSGWVNSVAFSPDGKLLASGSMDETVALWDVATGREVKRIDNQSTSVNSATFSPDGSLIATGSVDQMVRLWDVTKDPEEVHIVLDGHSGCINSVRFSPDGKLIISGSDDMTIKLWDTATGTDGITLKGHTKKVMAVAFSADARLIVSGSEDKTVRLWDALSGVALSTLRDHTSGINSVLFSPNGKLLASSSFDDEVRLWDTKTTALIGKLDDFDEDVNSGTLATQRPYVPALGEMIQSVKKFKGHSSTVTCVVFSPDGQLLASGSQDTTIKLWFNDGVERWKLEGHSGCINHLAFSPNSQLVASASTDNTVKLWNTATGAAIHTLEGHSDSVLLVLFSSDGRLLASCSTDSTTCLWNVATGAAIGRLEGHSDTVNDVAFSPDNHFIVSCSVDATILLWNLGTKAAPRTLRGHSDSVNSVAFSSDSKLFASCSDDSTIRLWSNTGMACGIIKGDMPQLSSVALSPDSQLVVASCSVDGTVRLWDLATKSAQGLLKTGVVIRKVTFSSCGKYIETDRGVLDVGSISFLSPSPSLTLRYTLFVTRDWLTRDMKNAIWLTDQFYATVVAARGEEIVLGHSSGRILFIYV